MAMKAPTTYTSFRTMAYELSCSNNTSLCKSQTSCLLILFPLLVIDEQAAKKKADKKTKDNQKKQNETIYLLPLSSFFCRQTVKDLFLLPKSLNQLICPSWHLLIIDISKLGCCNRRPCKPFTSEWLELAIKVCCSAHVRAIRFTIRTHKILRKVLSASKRLNFFICFRSLILVTIHAERN